MPARLKDLALDGAEAEIVFPSLALTAFLIENPEAELATAQVYYDWHHGMLKDYPHHEGTFPRSKEVIAHLFDDIDISESDKADILGLNAARLFRLPHPAVLAAA